jgi:hypothetical protein
MSCRVLGTCSCSCIGGMACSGVLGTCSSGCSSGSAELVICTCVYSAVSVVVVVVVWL